jgi:ADP-heptose:LPS heptosyltransferase
LELQFPEAKIDFIVKGTLAPILLKNYKSIDKIIELPKKPFKNVFKYMVTWSSVKTKTYDLAINPVVGSSSGKLLTSFSRARYKFYGELEPTDDNLNSEKELHIAKKPVVEIRKFLKKLHIKNSLEGSIPPLNLKLSENEKLEGKKVLEQMFNDTKPTIAIFTFATGTKCYSKEWWADFYNRIKLKYPSYNILEILPFETTVKILGKLHQ